MMGSPQVPGGNITGVTSAAGAGLLAKLIELTKETIPSATRVGILFNNSKPNDYATAQTGDCGCRRCNRVTTCLAAGHPSRRLRGSLRRSRTAIIEGPSEANLKFSLNTPDNLPDPTGFNGSGRMTRWQTDRRPALRKSHLTWRISWRRSKS